MMSLLLLIVTATSNTSIDDDHHHRFDRIFWRCICRLFLTDNYYFLYFLETPKTSTTIGWMIVPCTDDMTSGVL